MKALLTLLISFTLFTTAFAQNDAQRDEARRVILGDRNDPYARNDRRDVVINNDNRNGYGAPYSQRYQTPSREQRLYEINRSYDAQIYSVQYDRRFSRRERERTIRQLEWERHRQIDAVNDSYRMDRRYDDRNNDYGNSDNRNNRGNHYGWDRGNGNPHKGY